MGLYVDSAYLPDVERVCRKLELAGATTNPSILLAAWQRGQKLTGVEVLKELLQVCPGNIFMQPSGETTETLYQMAVEYRSLAPERVVPKLPLTVAGMEVGRRFKQEGVRFSFTCVFTVAQAYCGALAGAQYVIPYFGRLRRSGQDACERIEAMVHLLSAQRLATRVLAASIKTSRDAEEALLAGAHDLTATPEVLEALLGDPLTDVAVEQFERDWSTLQTSRSS